MATFLDDGKGAATEVKADQPIKITLPSTVTVSFVNTFYIALHRDEDTRVSFIIAWQIDSSTGCQVTPSGQPCGGLCCTLDGREFSDLCSSSAMQKNNILVIELNNGNEYIS